VSVVWVLTDRRYLRQRMPAALVEWLKAAGARTRVVVAEEVVAGVGPAARDAVGDPWAGVAPGDVVLARTRNLFALSLLPAVEAREGVRVLTPSGPIAAVRDKPRTALRLAELGIPMPPTFMADAPATLTELGGTRFPMLLKPHAGDNARGIALARTPEELDELEWHDGMVVAQQFVETDGYDLKIYAVGDRVWGVRRPSPLNLGRRPRDRQEFELVALDESRRELARACGRAFGLALFGIDVLESPEGPLVVDVNEFPNYTGIDEAVEAAGRLVLDSAREDGR